MRLHLQINYTHLAKVLEVRNAWGAHKIGKHLKAQLSVTNLCTKKVEA